MRYLSRPELRRLLEVARSESATDHLLLLMTYLHALRCQEAVNLHIGPTFKRIACVKGGKPSSIPVGYVEGNHITVWRLKGSERTVQPLVESPDSLFNEKAILETLPAGPIFPNYTRHTMSNRFRKFAKMAGLPRHLQTSPHGLKHSCLFHALNADPEKRAKINELQAYAGHKSGASTLRYLVVDQETASRAVISALTT